jgi:hypothetical protein
MTCARIGCDRQPYSRQHCRTHYELWRRTGRLGGEPDYDLVDAQPLVDAILHRVEQLQHQTDRWVGVKTVIVDDADRRAWYRARKAGVIREVIADRLCIRALGRTIDEVY